MSRTTRKILKKIINDVYGRYKYWCTYRKVRTTATRRAEIASVSDILEEGFTPDSRACARANLGNHMIPSSYDDVQIAALHEVECGHHPATEYPKWRTMKPRLVEYQIRGCPDCKWLETTIPGRLYECSGSCMHPKIVAPYGSGRKIEKVRYGRFTDFCPLKEVKL